MKKSGKYKMVILNRLVKDDLELVLLSTETGRFLSAFRKLHPAVAGGGSAYTDNCFRRADLGAFCSQTVPSTARDAAHANDGGAGRPH